MLPEKQTNKQNHLNENRELTRSLNLWPVKIVNDAYIHLFIQRMYQIKCYRGDRWQNTLFSASDII